MDRNKLRELKAKAYAEGDKQAWKYFHDALYQPRLVPADVMADIERMCAPEPEPTPAAEPPQEPVRRGRRHPEANHE